MRNNLQLLSSLFFVFIVLGLVVGRSSASIISRDLQQLMRTDPSMALVELRNKLAEQTGLTERLELQLAITKAARYAGKLDEAMDAVEEALAKAEQSHSTELLLKCRREKAVLLFQRGWMEEAHALLEVSLRLAYFYENKEAQAGLLGVRAMVRWRNGDLHMALSELLQSAEILESLDLPAEMASTYNNIGILFFHLYNYERSLFYYNKARHIKDADPIEDTVFEAALLSNIGEVLSSMGEFEQAREYTYQSLQYERRIGNVENIAYTLFNLGELYSKMKEYDKAKEYYLEALQIQREVGYEWAISATLLRIGQDYLQLGKYGEALVSLSEGLLMAYRLEATVLIRDYFEALAQTHRGLKDTRLHTHYLREHARMSELTQKTGVTSWHYSQPQRQLSSTQDTSDAHAPAAEKDNGNPVITAAEKNKYLFENSAVAWMIIVLLLTVLVLLVLNHKLSRTLAEDRLSKLS